MNILKHRLTEEEKEYAETCLEYIDSNDHETVKLGISLFLEKFKNYKFSIRIKGKDYLVKLNPEKNGLNKYIIRRLFSIGYCYY